MLLLLLQSRSVAAHASYRHALTWSLVQCLQQCMQQQHGVLGLQHANDELDAATASLWFAGKQLLPRNQLSHHLGRHEKTKAVIKLQQAGQGAPVREAVQPLSALHHCMCCCFFGSLQPQQRRLLQPNPSTLSPPSPPPSTLSWPVRLRRAQAVCICSAAAGTQ